MNGSSVDERGVVQPTKRRIYVMFDNKGNAYHWSCVYQVTQTYKNPSQSHTYSSNLSTCHSSLQALISLTDDHSLLSKMAALESCPKHNMIAYLEKTEGNVEFHELTVPTSGLYTFESKKIAQDVRARIQGKNSLVKHFEDMRLCRPSKEYFQLVPIDTMLVQPTQAEGASSERLSDAPLFDTMLVQPTQAEGASSERLSDAQPSPSPAPTSEVPNESLPDSTSAQPSEVPFEQQPDPSPSPSPQPSPTPTIPDSIPEPSGENHEDHSSNDASLSGNEDDMTLQNVYDLCISLCQQVSDQAKEIKLLKAKITKLKKQAQPVIKHFKAYLKTVSLQKRIPKKSSSKKQRMHKKNVSKQGRKIEKGESSVQRDPMFDVMPEDNIDHMEADNAQSEGRTKEEVDEEKEFDEVRLSTEDGISTDFEKVSTDKPKISTDGSKVSTDEQVEGTEEIFEGTEEQRESTEAQREGTEDQTKEESATPASQTSTQTPTSMIFGDDETIAYIFY
ncbi:hypothetical protein Tco_0776671 [Tanacetum coccineum]